MGDPLDDFDEEEERGRRFTLRRESDGDPRTLIVGGVVCALLALLAGYLIFGRSTPEKTLAFDKPDAPFAFTYPDGFSDRTKALSKGVARNRPAYQVALGPARANTLLAATYDLAFTVNGDGTATGRQGQEITADELNSNVDAAMAQIAEAAGMREDGSVQQGQLGPLPARVYEYAKPDGSLRTTFVVAFDGDTQFFVSCQRTDDADVAEQGREGLRDAARHVPAALDLDRYGGEEAAPTVDRTRIVVRWRHAVTGRLRARLEQAP